MFGIELNKSLFSKILLTTLFISTIEQWPRGVASQEEKGCRCMTINQCKNYYGVNVSAINTSENRCKSADVCCPIDTFKQPTTILASSTSLFGGECGNLNHDGLFFKITNGQDTSFGQVPWMVAVLSEKNGAKHLECGGSLIHEQVVLTAAHCITNFTEKSEMENLVALGGAWDLNSTEELYPHQYRKVQKIIIHNDFNSKTGFYDIALLILKDPFEDTYNVALICLPSEKQIILPYNCVVTGWGKESKEVTNFESLLKMIELSIVPRSECQDLLRETRLGKRFKLHDSFICAGGVDGDVCLGDGGGPLICKIEGDALQYIQMGIVSWGIDCGVAPGVYTDVTPLVGWIKQQIINVGFQFPY